MSRRDSNSLGLKIGLVAFFTFILPKADTVWWMILLIGAIQGVGILTILNKLFDRFLTDENNK